MPTIDQENAKQIRQPMDVLITMSLADTEISMTYSGYSSAKVADGVLDERSWSMRKLADLQGDGFPLDGSCVLYDSATQPSQANGKLGVRSNVGESVSVTATGSKVMASIGASVSGAESVTMNGVTTDITSSTVVLPLLDTTATLTFNPASETERIEISTILPEADFKITNENLIRATVSLRSDLSILEPTLPESEINIEAYFNEDVSEAVAQIPEDVPVIYQAGYEGDMSPERKFYVSGQVTWADNVLSIHAVDAVHFLDVDTPACIAVGDPDYGASNAVYPTSLTGLYRMMYYLLTSAGVNVDGYNPGVFDECGTYATTIIEKNTHREIIANLMNLLHQDIPANALRGITSFWPTYVDAGRPTIYVEKHEASHTILEGDCADIQKSVENKISGFEIDWANDIRAGFYQDNITWQKNTGVFLAHDNDYIIYYNVAANFEQDPSRGASWNAITPVYEGVPNSSIAYCGPVLNDKVDTYGEFLLGADIPKGTIIRMIQAPPHTITGQELYTQIIPWSANMQTLWNQIVGSTDDSYPLTIFGRAFIREQIKKTYGSFENVTISQSEKIWGRCYTRGARPTYNINIIPDGAYISLLNRSNITGSFTWKGDPRMQPRDVVEWERLDGTTETITLENITITHEGGGTSAEITYRKGVV